MEVVLLGLVRVVAAGTVVATHERTQTSDYSTNESRRRVYLKGRHGRREDSSLWRLLFWEGQVITEMTDTT